MNKDEKSEFFKESETLVTTFNKLRNMRIGFLGITDMRHDEGTEIQLNSEFFKELFPGVSGTKRDDCWRRMKTEHEGVTYIALKYEGKGAVKQ
jgi:hypothetical protein